MLLLMAPAATLAFIAAEGPEDKPQKGDAYRDVDRFVKVLQHIRHYYVDETDDDQLLRAAVKRMLGNLDPHTQFLETNQLRSLRTGTTGQYTGVGMEMSTRRGYPVVVTPMENTPARRAGLQTGDLIMTIDGKDTFGMLLQDVASSLKGPAGTPVSMTVRRKGEPEALDFHVVRDVIRIPSLPVCSAIDSDIGYVRVARYAAGTASELDSCLNELESEGVRGLILDLRGNPGGLLLEAVRVCEQFLPEGKLVVFTQGRREGESVEYLSRSTRTRDDLPLVVLVDGGTASAAEIVAGAIQDWDLGLIVGSGTFGKGSVQRVMELGGERALKMTTSYYYTPSGRCIHKKTEDEGFEDGDLAEGVVTGDTRGTEGAAADAQNDSQKEFTTAGGRTVFGGGGISPDVVVVPADLPGLAGKAEGRGLFFSFAVDYVGKNPGLEEPSVTPAVMEDFREFLLDEGLSFDETEFESAAESLSLGVRRELARRMIDDEAATLAAMKGDRQLQVAVGFIKDAAVRDDLFKLALKYNGGSQ